MNSINLIDSFPPEALTEWSRVSRELRELSQLNQVDFLLELGYQEALRRLILRAIDNHNEKLAEQLSQEMTEKKALGEAYREAMIKGETQLTEKLMCRWREV